MTLNPHEQETTVKGRDKELFRDHIGQFLLSAASFLEIFWYCICFSEIKKCLHDWRQMLFTTVKTSVVKVWIFLW